LKPPVAMQPAKTPLLADHNPCHCPTSPPSLSYYLYSPVVTLLLH
jgi:hypothetical protein